MCAAGIFFFAPFFFCIARTSGDPFGYTGKKQKCGENESFCSFFTAAILFLEYIRLMPFINACTGNDIFSYAKARVIALPRSRRYTRAKAAHRHVSCQAPDLHPMPFSSQKRASCEPEKPNSSHLCCRSYGRIEKMAVSRAADTVSTQIST